MAVLGYPWIRGLKYLVGESLPPCTCLGVRTYLLCTVGTVLIVAILVERQVLLWVL